MRNSLLLAIALALGSTAGAAPQPPKAVPAAVRVKLTTTDGAIVLELDPARAPLTVANFLQYVKDRHYEGTVFHRVIPGFMVQGGGYGAKLVDGEFVERPTRPPIKLEVRRGLTNVRGTIAMARTPDPDSATSQFFINLVDNSAKAGSPNLDTMGGGYAVFGRVVEGMEVVDRIAAIPTGPGGQFSKDVPFRNALITKAEVLPAPKPADATPAKQP
jgi:peptidyl-prolyl cis-trans isomerase A (cyclophilin A)